MRLLLSAYACEPGRGSEPGVGWNWAIALAALGHDVWVLTRANNRDRIEQALAVWLTCVHENQLTLDDIVLRMHTNPARIFGVSIDEGTHIEIDPDETWVVRAEHQFTKAGWTPYAGLTMRGRVHKTVLRGIVAYDGEEVLAWKGMGRETGL